MSNLSNQGLPFYIRELVNSSFYEFVTPRYNAVRAREKRGVYIDIVDNVGWVSSEKSVKHFFRHFPKKIHIFETTRRTETFQTILEISKDRLHFFIK